MTEGEYAKHGLRPTPSCITKQDYAILVSGDEITIGLDSHADAMAFTDWLIDRLEEAQAGAA